MTKRLLHLVRFFIFALSIYVLHHVAIRYYLYWTVSWFDILMHFSGGLLVGYGVYAFFYLFGKRAKFLPIMASVLIVGILWEVFEYGVGLTDFSELGDMALDLVMDMLGGLSAYFITRRCD